VCIGYTKYVASISNHVKIGSVTCLFWLPLLENRGSQNSSEQSCDSLLFHSISVPNIRSTPNSKWSSLHVKDINLSHCATRPQIMVILKFIYSLAAFPNESEGFISTSEDRTVRIWKGKYGMQITKVSVWVS
jgi:hypothetical protein